MSVRLIQVTLGSGATQVSATTAPFDIMLVQNNDATHDARLGDSTVTTSKGINVLHGGGLPIVIEKPQGGSPGDASNFYVIGTQNSLIDVLLY